MQVHDSTRSVYVVPEPLRLTGRYLSDTAHIDALPALDTHEAAWAAGFFDGEGCTFLGHHGRQGLATPCTDVSQLHPGVLERFRLATGGLGSMRLRPDRPQRRPNPMWSFSTRNWRSTQAVLTVLWPYLSDVKRQQASGIFAAYQAIEPAHPKLGQPRMRMLTTNQKAEIRQRFAAGGITKWQLGLEYGVSDVMIGVVIRSAPGRQTARAWNALLGAWEG